MLELRLRKRVGGLAIDVELPAARDTVLIAGPNGAGKTTLLRLLLGLVRPDAGSVALNRRTLFDDASGVDVAPEARAIGYVPQDYALFPHLDVRRNVEFGLSAMPAAERSRRARHWLERLGIAAVASRKPGSLSGGERQRVALARALAREPKAIVLDEPFASLDAEARRDLRVSLRSWLRDWRLPALLVSHDPADAAVADRVAVIESGKLVQQGTLDDLRASPATPYVAAFQRMP